MQYVFWHSTYVWIHYTASKEGNSCRRLAPQLPFYFCLTSSARRVVVFKSDWLQPPPSRIFPIQKIATNDWFQLLHIYNNRTNQHYTYTVQDWNSRRLIDHHSTKLRYGTVRPAPTLPYKRYRARESYIASFALYELTEPPNIDNPLSRRLRAIFWWEKAGNVVVVVDSK